MINSFNDIKNMNELNEFGGDVYAWAEYLADRNERFRGLELNEGKKDRLDYMNACCRQITEIEKSISIRWLPFTDRSRNALVMLKIPTSFYYRDWRVISLFAELFRLTDDVHLCCPDGEGWLGLSFGILDMWDSFYYDYGENE